jgi:hypothetical protein
VRAPSAALLDHDPDMLAAFEDPDYPPPPDDEELPPPTPSDWTNSCVGTRAHFYAFFLFKITILFIYCFILFSFFFAFFFFIFFYQKYPADCLQLGADNFLLGIPL